MSLSEETGKLSRKNPILDRLQAGGRKSLARAITIVENNLDGRQEILTAVSENLGNAHVVGVTGPPGVGKSTLIDACIPEIRKRGKTVAVLAVDPSSHTSGGAILGDRVRMAQHGQDDGVFIRSVAARGHLGGLSSTALNIINLFDATDWDTIIVETVGTGQSEIEISILADTTVVVESPGRGDEVQAIKAGLLEIADVVVVNKSDVEHSDATVSDIRQAISLRHASKQPELMKTTATSGEGIDELIDVIIQQGEQQTGDNHRNSKTDRLQKLVARMIGEAVGREFQNADSQAISNLVQRISTGQIDAEQVARQIKSYLENYAGTVD